MLKALYLFQANAKIISCFWIISSQTKSLLIARDRFIPSLTILKDIPKVKYLDIGKHFLDDKGHLSKEMMPDTTHPSEKGHEIWAKAIESELVRIVGR